MSEFTEKDLADLAICEYSGERRRFCSHCQGKDWYPAASITDVPEAQIEAEVTKLLEEDGWRALRTDPVSDRSRGKGFGELGMADHLYLRYKRLRPANPGSFRPAEWMAEKPGPAEVMWIEFKRAGQLAKKHQLEWHSKERARGALTLIAGSDFAASVEGFKDWYRSSGLMRRPM